MAMHAAGRPLVWPWTDHEGCVVYLLRLHGEVCGRICKACNVVETHLAVDPGDPGPVVGTLHIDQTPVGSA